jgi:hypothetical protein
VAKNFAGSQKSSRKTTAIYNPSMIRASECDDDKLLKPSKPFTAKDFKGMLSISSI